MNYSNLTTPFIISVFCLRNLKQLHSVMVRKLKRIVKKVMVAVGKGDGWSGGE